MNIVQFNLFVCFENYIARGQTFVSDCEHNLEKFCKPFDVIMKYAHMRCPNKEKQQPTKLDNITQPKNSKKTEINKSEKSNLRNTADFVVGESHFAGAAVSAAVILAVSFGLNPF